MKRKIVTILLLLASLNAQDLKTTVSEIISSNPVILERLNNYEGTKQDIDRAFSGYYPKLDLKLGVGKENTNKKDLAGVEESFDYNVYQTSLKYTQNIFSGFQTLNQVQEQKYRTASAAYSYVENVNNTSFKMVNTYLELMKNQELLGTAKKNVQINEEIFAKVDKLYNAGLTTLSEVNKIESTLALAKSNLVVQENMIMDSSYKLQGVLGRELNPEKMQKPVISVTLPKTQEEALSYAINNNPSILVSDFTIKLSQAVSSEKKSPFYPAIDIMISQSMNKNLSAIAGEDDQLKAMAYLSYNLFNGFADQAEYEKSKSVVFQEVQTKNSLKRQVKENLNLAWAANTKLTEQLKYLMDYKEFSHKTLNLYVKEYDLGRRSLLDLLSSQNDYIHAQAQIITTEYSILYSKYRILDSMGLLVTSILGEDDIVYSKVNLDK